MKKRILSLLLAAISAFSFSLPALAAGADIADPYDDLDEYDQYTISFKHNVMSAMEVDSFQDNIDAAKSYVESLNLEEQNLGYISESCLAQLDELALVPDCILNEYTVLVPKSRADTPKYAVAAGAALECWRNGFIVGNGTGAGSCPGREARHKGLLLRVTACFIALTFTFL